MENSDNYSILIIIVQTDHVLALDSLFYILGYIATII